MSQTTNRTDDVVASMLVENTGKHFLDSGFAYGRAWQKNRDNHPRDAPPIQVHRDYVSKNVYHHLTEYFTRSVTVDHKSLTDEYEYETHTLEELESIFYEWANTDERKGDGWLTCMREFAELLNDGPNAPFTENTYNFESDLSQVLQYTAFDVDGQTLVLLQVHNGADVRGGYTKPRLFAGDEYALISVRVDAWCRNCGYDSDSMYQASKDGARFDEEANAVYCPECDHELSLM